MMRKLTVWELTNFPETGMNWFFDDRERAERAREIQADPENCEIHLHRVGTASDIVRLINDVSRK